MYRHFLFNLFLSRLDLGPVFCGNFIAGPGRRIGFNYLPHSGILRYLLAGNLAEAAYFFFLFFFGFISGEVDSGPRSSGRLKHNALLAMSNISGEVDSGLLKIPFSDSGQHKKTQESTSMVLFAATPSTQVEYCSKSLSNCMTKIIGQFPKVCQRKPLLQS